MVKMQHINNLQNNIINQMKNETEKKDNKEELEQSLQISKLKKNYITVGTKAVFGGKNLQTQTTTLTHM